MNPREDLVRAAVLTKCTLISAWGRYARNMRPKVGVIGSARDVEPRVAGKAREVGRAIVEGDAILLTGASTGVSYEAVRGAKEAGGLAVGFSPASSLREHVSRYRLPVDLFDLLVFTGFGFKGRNVLFVRSCDAVVAVAGRMGTLNEFTIAYDEGRPVGVLRASGGLSSYFGMMAKKSRKKGPEVIYDVDPVRLVSRVLSVLRQEPLTPAAFLNPPCWTLPRWSSPV